MEFLQLVHELVPEGDEVEVLLITQSDRETCVKQAENLNQIAETFTGWKITLDRGLDIFQRYESGPLSLAQTMQEARLTRGVEVSYFRVG